MRRGPAILVLGGVLGVLGVVAVLAACGFDATGERPDGIGANVDAADGPGAQTIEGGPVLDGGPDDASVDALVPPDAPNGDAGLLFPYVYGHTVTTLYRLEPITKTWTVVGPLTGCNAMADIAVDRDGKIVGVGDDLYAIDPTTGTCTTIAPGPQPFTLTFVPAGTLDSTNEVLVAYSGSNYDRVDRTTGAVTQVTAAAIAPYMPSGDLVSVEGGGTYVSVTGPSCADCLLQVSPVTGVVVKNLGSIGVSEVFGLGAWSGKLYAFVGNGDTYELTLGASSVTAATLVPNPIKPSSWIGGGSSTRVPK